MVEAIWDLIAAKQYGEKYTLSYYVRDKMVAHPLLMVAIGILVGHFCAAA